MEEIEFEPCLEKWKSVAFKDVVMDFTQDLMLEKYRNLVLLGLPFSKPDVNSEKEDPGNTCSDWETVPRSDFFEDNSTALKEAIIATLPRIGPEDPTFQETWECDGRLESQQENQERDLRKVKIIHKKPSPGERGHEGSEPGRNFGLRSVLVMQQRIPAGKNLLKCNTHRKNSDLLKHHKIHAEEKTYACNDCGKGFSYCSSLSQHQKSHTGEKPYKCNECERAFCNCSALIQHQRIHTGEKPYECNECEKAFWHSANLTNYRRAHTGEKPYKCIQCGKFFGYCAAFIHHQRIHNGKKLYKCNECGKAFSQSANLTNHQRIHTRKKPCKCNQCGKDFSQSTNLIIHHKIHTREKPYEYNECGKAFSDSSILIRHHTFTLGKIEDKRKRE
uniref:C2H2-type domain-containing protein n=1 Tax=Vombatus ursinus TaxID=29139 RepID=A0A4X2K5S1_VOMUR